MSAADSNSNSSGSSTAPTAPTAAFARLKATVHRDAGAPVPPRAGAAMSLPARCLVFAVVPCLAGLAGLGVSRLQGRFSPGHQVDFHRDVVLPFRLTLLLVIAVGFQTNGFRGERRGVLDWARAQRAPRSRAPEGDGTKKAQ